MKSRVFFVVLMIVVVSTLVSSAQKPAEGWNVLVAYEHTFKTSAYRPSEAMYAGYSAGASYKHYFHKYFNFAPEARLFYRDFKELDQWTLGLTLRPALAFNFQRLELSTGPVCDLRFAGKTYDGRIGAVLEDGEIIGSGYLKSKKVAVLGWNFGIGYVIDRRFTIRCSCFVPITNYVKGGRSPYALEAAVGYCLGR
ncbi:MAG: hypothetical protein JFR38_10840 [Muribaculaceae bacterium]|nr:hypothetical protein [Muribaculaceae bacterium]